MKKTYFTVGPSENFSEIKQYALMATKDKIFMLSHRSKEFTIIHLQTCNELKKLLNVPKDFYVFFVGSATEGMERIIENLVAKKSYHFVNGYFSERFYNIAVQLKKNPSLIKTKFNEGFDFKKVSIPKNTELICFTQNETSTGAMLNMNEIYNIKKNNPDTLVAVDIVSSVPYVKIDFSKIDVALFSVQKGFGMPPGMGVLIVKKSCIEKTKWLKSKNYNIGSYHNFIAHAENYEKHQTPVTPNVASIYILGKISKLLNQKGLEKIRKETDLKAEMLYTLFEKHNYVRPFIKDRLLRSKTTLVFETIIDSERIIHSLAQKGYVINSGYSEFKNSHIRIGNFPVHKVEEMEKLVHTFKNL